VTVIAVMSGVHRARWDGFFNHATDNQRFVDAALYIDAISPEATVVFAMQHSGSVRFYSGRQTLRYDVLDPEWLDRSLDTLQHFGFSAYALLEDWEEQSFRNRFRDQRATKLLDAGPLAVRRTGRNELRLFELNKAKTRPNPEPLEIPRTSRFSCLDVSPRVY
jgi:hypothetical protein